MLTFNPCARSLPTYSDEHAQRIMEMLSTITEDELSNTTMKSLYKITPPEPPLPEAIPSAPVHGMLDSLPASLPVAVIEI